MVTEFGKPAQDAIRNAVKELWQPTIKVKLDGDAKLPVRAHDTDAGADLFAPETFVLPAHGSHVVDTGVHIELPPFTKAELVPKSGLNVSCSILSFGLIDEGYTGPIKVKLYNHSDKPHIFYKGDKITQLVISPVLYPTYVKTDEIAGGERGDGGFGSTGR
jgi:dUTP pyrophosphatase